LSGADGSGEVAFLNGLHETLFIWWIKFTEVGAAVNKAEHAPNLELPPRD